MTREEATRWLQQAQTDLPTAENLLADEDFDACSFFCQQVAEKALKAILYAHGERPFGHRLVQFLERIEAITPLSITADQLAGAAKLDDHYVSGRYPDALKSSIPAEHYTADMAEEALEWAKQLLQFASNYLH
jgi:HEPN domain-containing protein